MPQTGSINLFCSELAVAAATPCDGLGAEQQQLLGVLMTAPLLQASSKWDSPPHARVGGRRYALGGRQDPSPQSTLYPPTDLVGRNVASARNELRFNAWSGRAR